MIKGFIYLHRNLFDHFLYTEKPFCRLAAFVDMILTANHQKNQILFDGELVTVNRGEFITSIRKLSDRWGWSRTKTTKFLKLLEKENMIIIKSDKKKTVLTLINYGKFQGFKDTEKPLKSHLKTTQKTLKSTNNNDNNDNNENNNIYNDFHNRIYMYCVKKEIQNIIIKKSSVFSFTDQLDEQTIMSSIDRSAGKDVEYLLTVLRTKVKEKHQPIKSNQIKTTFKSNPKPKLVMANHYNDSSITEQELKELQELALKIDGGKK